MPSFFVSALFRVPSRMSLCLQLTDDVPPDVVSAHSLHSLLRRNIRLDNFPSYISPMIHFQKQYFPLYTPPYAVTYTRAPRSTVFPLRILECWQYNTVKA